MRGRILVTGGSIAGCSAAWWLTYHGYKVTLVEKADGFRDGGQNIDVRGAGRKVLQTMDLEKKALASGTGEIGTAWVKEDGSVVGKAFITEELGGDGPTAEMEILRGDLARMIYEAVGDRAVFRFGDTVASLDDDGEGVDVNFSSGMFERFDAVVVAEGVGSPTRELVFPKENDPRWMNMSMAYFTIPRTAEDDRLWRWYHTTGGRSVSLRPDRHGTTRAMLSVQRPPGPELDWTEERRKAWLRETFHNAGWESDRVVAAMDSTDDFYFDVLRQVRMPRWSKGRVALLGDAAWCVTPLGGVGATLAVVGSYTLAGELSGGSTVPEAFKAYERRLRQYVDGAQSIPKFVPRLANPHSRAGIAILHGGVRLASFGFVRKALGKAFAGGSRDIELPRY